MSPGTRTVFVVTEMVARLDNELNRDKKLVVLIVMLDRSELTEMVEMSSLLSLSDFS